MATTTLPKIHVRKVAAPHNGTLIHAFQVTCDGTGCETLKVTRSTRLVADMVADAHQREHATGNLLDRLLAAHDTHRVYDQDVTA